MKPDIALVEQAFAQYRNGDLAAAESLLSSIPHNPSALHLLGLVRVRQGRIPEALDLLSSSVAAQPREAQARFNYGKVLAAVGRHSEAKSCFQAVLAIDPQHVEALPALGRSHHALGDFDQAVEFYERFLQKEPTNTPAKIAMGNTLVAAGRTDDGIAILTATLEHTGDRRLCAELHRGLTAAYRKRLDYQSALKHLEQLVNLDPSREEFLQERAVLLESAHFFEEAKAAYEQTLEREPAESWVHRRYNDLLYRLGDRDNFLASYWRAPRTKELLLDKAQFLLSAERWEEARTNFETVITRYGEDKAARLGIGLALLKGHNINEAVSVLERAAQTYPDSVDVHCNLAGALAELGDAPKAIEAANRALGLDRFSQPALAVLGTSLRLVEEGRDELLNSYDEFVRVFDLEPPTGFPDMASFNTALASELSRMHPNSGPYLRQSLRGGTQTSDNLFDCDNSVLAQLRARIEMAVKQYISELREDDDHPLLCRRRAEFRFSGSWSSRLHDRGFHINHLHPGGWISSCYYVEVPEVASDLTAQQGWIKFGEPSFDVGLKARRTIQPLPGRLVLFPSYMWHGTVPFHDRGSRMTVAFDVVPI